MAQRQSKIKAQSFCVFCGGANLSKEHIWSDWLKPHMQVKPSHEQTRFHIVYDQRANAAVVAPSLDTRRGAMHQKKIRKVCQTCNSGWMSSTVSVAKAAAEKLILGQQAILQPEEQKQVASWLAISIIMAEYTDPSTQMIPEQDRKVLFTTNNPPDSWMISLGRYSGKDWENLRYRHHGFRSRIVVPPRGPVAVEYSADYDTQVTTMVIGHLFIQAFCSTGQFFREKFSQHSRWPDLLQQIWPAQARVVDSHATPLITDQQANEIADTFYLKAISNKLDS